MVSLQTASGQTFYCAGSYPVKEIVIGHHEPLCIVLYKHEESLHLLVYNTAADELLIEGQAYQVPLHNKTS